MIVHVIFEVSRIFVFLKIIHFNPHSLSFLSYWGFLRWLFYWQAVQTEGGFSFQGCPDKRCFTDFISFFSSVSLSQFPDLRYLLLHSIPISYSWFPFPVPIYGSCSLNDALFPCFYSLLLKLPVSINFSC